MIVYCNEWLDTIAEGHAHEYIGYRIVNGSDDEREGMRQMVKLNILCQQTAAPLYPYAFSSH